MAEPTEPQSVPPCLELDAEVARHAALLLLAYEREREPAAKRLGVRVRSSTRLSATSETKHRRLHPR